MHLAIINLICLSVGFFILQRLFGNQIFSYWRFDWLNFILSLVIGFFSAAFLAGVVEASFEVESIKLGSATSWIFIALYVLMTYIAITHLRQSRNK